MDLIVAAATTGSANADGRSGGALSLAYSEGAQLLSPMAGPYYAWPVLGGLAPGTVACALLLRRVTAWYGSDDQRRTRVRATVGAWGVLVTAPLFAVSLTMGVVVLSLSCAGGMKDVALWELAVTALISALTACHCLGVLLLPRAYIKARP
ncbi:hypothetical protein OG520_41410 (plasmid) [Streptomyces sp. NBC_00984]|uniref:hypothetical protein n=1 Tax=Streptomyces sp. NBC_00984 TaxID=2903700 RepID=UPI002F916B13|nr:hypothetical protein OG520_41410 [Streptomyces sp. NBC_00984]